MHVGHCNLAEELQPGVSQTLLSVTTAAILERAETPELTTDRVSLYKPSHTS